ncbi:2-hydroxyacid dehydrogenase [Paenibacillus darwinianus]|uniref:2-hydroxyacid dehydrogenase n=1 Tax=Paenibacillus darwinianus TaxID=1380763 RepID=A0A9W5RYD4_9BACL|nr:D-2-hydroxyacid dehydrogenase [Paenibacillus darwinianus]EXX84677.1 2-hydroxyacid dehydrogenase [Paenibacillus darwinianus]EXX84708.1 2-hydroxyacid dehydrogenase [Paenibacillus darwinianus]EXX84721.1 2-hydroxyacid dehydrogenase [Paenibacillus darwinianus]
MRTMICLHGFTPEQQEAVRKAVPGWRVVFGRTGEVEAALYKEAEIVCGWNGDAARECLAPDSRLRWVQTWSAGVDKLPLARLAAKGALLTGASGVHPAPMSETVFALMLGLTRGIHRAVRAQTNGRWDRPAVLPEMHGKTAVIVGAGKIGQEVARLAQAFSMTTLGVRRSGEPAPSFDRMLTSERLDEALSQADYVINILPLTDETRHLFDEGRFAHMRSSAYFINAGRGETVRTEALVDALRNGAIAGAGLDVFEQEPLPEDHPLWSLDNVILTPHTGGSTASVKERVAAIFLANLPFYLSGETHALLNLIDYSRGY